MFFGLLNAPVNFQGYIKKILAKKLNIFIILYLDNIFIYTKNPGQSCINVVWWVFKKLKKNSFFANLKKCQFHKNKSCFPSYVLLALECK